jgi:hypothetical protein
VLVTVKVCTGEVRVAVETPVPVPVVGAVTSVIDAVAVLVTATVRVLVGSEVAVPVTTELPVPVPAVLVTVPVPAVLVTVPVPVGLEVTLPVLVITPVAVSRQILLVPRMYTCSWHVPELQIPHVPQNPEG